ncbi:uncharacterized protein JCM6883_003610 [Sporobolomyces salmoneus]|uniref:uncharacterized protein n=1 Tax=Sporobolomyces salmoneus TaxID=183962 RepID=UPI003173C963
MGNLNSNTRRGADEADKQGLKPSVRDTRYVAALLVRAKKVPVELVIDILELADYTAKMTTSSARQYNVQAGWSGNRQSVAILQTRPIPSIPDVSDENAIRGIRVYTDAHDQGFSSFPEHHNTREASSSWFELALVRSPLLPVGPSTATDSQNEDSMPGTLPTSDDPPRPLTAQTNRLPVWQTVSRIRLYSNLHAVREFNSYSITLEKRQRGRSEGDETEQDEFMRLVRPGDRLVLYAMAQYPAWSNTVRECRIEVEMKSL